MSESRLEKRWRMYPASRLEKRWGDFSKRQQALPIGIRHLILAYITITEWLYTPTSTRRRRAQKESFWLWLVRHTGHSLSVSVWWERRDWRSQRNHPTIEYLPKVVLHTPSLVQRQQLAALLSPRVICMREWKDALLNTQDVDMLHYFVHVLQLASAPTVLHMFTEDLIGTFEKRSLWQGLRLHCGLDRQALLSTLTLHEQINDAALTGHVLFLRELRENFAFTRDDLAKEPEPDGPCLPLMEAIRGGRVHVLEELRTGWGCTLVADGMVRLAETLGWPIYAGHVDVLRELYHGYGLRLRTDGVRSAVVTKGVLMMNAMMLRELRVLFGLTAADVDSTMVSPFFRQQGNAHVYGQLESTLFELVHGYGHEPSRALLENLRSSCHE